MELRPVGRTPSRDTNDDVNKGLFGEIKEHRVTFCIDTSGSMYNCLDTVKEHVIRALKLRAIDANEGDQFNVIEFSTSVVKWAEQLVEWNEQTAEVAAKWIRNLMPKTGTNTRDALVAALQDSNCDSVYLITDSIPDQRVNDVIDVAVNIAGNRPIHCFYVHAGFPDQLAVSFLTELAMETYGSFHIVIVSQYGLLERVEKVYHAETSQDRIVRSTSGGIFSTAHKLCSVGTTVEGPMPVSLPISGTAPILQQTSLMIPPWPYHLYPWPYRYYYALIEPRGREWTRFRPAKAWLKQAQDFVDSVTSVPVPGAGSMLIGTRVLVRRHVDGLFYNGSVKSQLMDDKFLVEIGPCKHGKYTDCEYQETHVYDIVSLTDSLRHPVLVDDKVLAPWEPEGERYAPGIVIDGHERRMADNGEPDKQLVVALYDGKTVNVPYNKALWIPVDFYERVTFEIKLPRGVRKEFATQDLYPYYTSCGYPPSGSLAFPAQFERYVPAAWLPATIKYPVGWAGGECRGSPWMAYLDDGGSRTLGRYPVNDRLKAIEGDELIPGTDMTKSQLNSKVMTQIMQNKMTMSKETGSDTGVLKKINSPSEYGLKKSVSFVDLRDDSKLELSDARDSGHGSQAELSFSDSDLEADNNEDGTSTRDIAVGTDRSLSALSLRKSRSANTQRQRAWKYWKNNPAPSLTEPMHYGPYREGPYRDCADFPSTLLRDANKNWANTVEWTSPLGRVVDHAAQYKYQPNVKDCMYMPTPPGHKPVKQGPGKDLSEALGSHQRTEERLAEMRRDYRQQQVLAREIGWQRRAADEEQAKLMSLNQRRMQVQTYAEVDQTRIRNQQVRAENTLAAKQQITQQLNQRFRENAENFGERDARKIAALSVNRINRNLQATEREFEAQHVYAHRQANKEMQRVARIEANIARMSELDRQMAAQQQSKARSQSAHVAHFERKERDAQRRKEYATLVSDQTQAILRSQILP